MANLLVFRAKADWGFEDLVQKNYNYGEYTDQFNVIPESNFGYSFVEWQADKNISYIDKNGTRKINARTFPRSDMPVQIYMSDAITLYPAFSIPVDFYDFDETPLGTVNFTGLRDWSTQPVTGDSRYKYSSQNNHALYSDSPWSTSGNEQFKLTYYPIDVFCVAKILCPKTYWTESEAIDNVSIASGKPVNIITADKFNKFYSYYYRISMWGVGKTGDVEFVERDEQITANKYNTLINLVNEVSGTDFPEVIEGDNILPEHFLNITQTYNSLQKNFITRS